MRSLFYLVLFLAGILALPTHAKNLTVFAAASTVQVLDEIRNTWNAENSPQLRIVYGSSGALARQIENGAPADIYFSANSTWVDYLVKQKIVRNETRQTIFRNRIVLIAPASAQLPTPFNLTTDIGPALGQNGRLAIGNPQHVPAGIYGRQALSGLGLWSQFAHRTVQTRNVRLALALVQRGEAPLGIVYYTDALQTGQVRIVATINGSLHAPIDYQAIATRSANTTAAAPAVTKLLAYLASDASREIYRKFGFLTR
jgi:molybdate transport system substrate-binding protein